MSKAFRRRSIAASLTARPVEHPIRIRVYDHSPYAVNTPVGKSVLVQVYPSAPWAVARALIATSHRAAVEASGGANSRGPGAEFYFSSTRDAVGVPDSTDSVEDDSGSDDAEHAPADTLSDARVFLLPGGEEILSTAMLREGDAVTVHRGRVEPPAVHPVGPADVMGRSGADHDDQTPPTLPTAAVYAAPSLARTRSEVQPPRRSMIASKPSIGRMSSTASAAGQPGGRRRRRSIPSASSSRMTDSAADDIGAVDAAVQELVNFGGEEAASEEHMRDAPRKRFQRAVQRVIFVNRFRAASDRPKKHATGDLGLAVATGLGQGRAGSVNASVAGRGRSNKRSTAGKSVDAYIKGLVDLYEYAQTRIVDDRINMEKLPWHVVNPDGPLKTTWDIMTLVLVVYFAFMVPFRIGFDTELAPGEQTFDTIADVIFIIDVLLSFRTAFKQDGIWVFTTKRMAERYLTTWFLIDILASFPIGWFVSGAETKVNKLFRMLRLFKLFRILRLLKLFPRVMAIIEQAVKFNPALLRFVRSFVVLFIIWHNMGCIYYFVAREEYGGIRTCLPETEAEPGDPVGTGVCYVNHCVCKDGGDADDFQVLAETTPGWYDPRDPDIWVPHFTIANAPVQTQYWLSLFWAVQVTTGIGNDIKPKSDTEVMFTTFMAVLGLVVYAVIIGSASSALQNMDADASMRREVLESASNFMQARKVPLFFQKIIKDYYEHMWQSPRDADEVFADLPPTLRARLSIVINRDLVDRIPLLQLIPADVYIRTVHRLERATFLPGEYVVKQGQAGDSILLIDRGRVDAVLPNGRTVFLTLYPGDFFGESSLLYDTLRDASFRAVDYLDLFIMDRLTFDELCVSAPGFMTEVRRVDAERQSARLRIEFEQSLGVQAGPDEARGEAAEPRPRNWAQAGGQFWTLESKTKQRSPAMVAWRWCGRLCCRCCAAEHKPKVAPGSSTASKLEFAAKALAAGRQHRGPGGSTLGPSRYEDAQGVTESRRSGHRTPRSTKSGRRLHSGRKEDARAVPGAAALEADSKVAISEGLPQPAPGQPPTPEVRSSEGRVAGPADFRAARTRPALRQQSGAGSRSHSSTRSVGFRVDDDAPQAPADVEAAARGTQPPRRAAQLAPTKPATESGILPTEGGIASSSPQSVDAAARRQSAVNPAELQKADTLLNEAKQLGWEDRGPSRRVSAARSAKELRGDDTSGEVADLFLRALRRQAKPSRSTADAVPKGNSPATVPAAEKASPGGSRSGRSPATAASVRPDSS